MRICEMHNQTFLQIASSNGRIFEPYSTISFTFWNPPEWILTIVGNKIFKEEEAMHIEFT